MSILNSQTLLVRYSFLVTFLVKNAFLPYPMNIIRFQKVSGLKVSVDTDSMHQGGDNDSTYYLPKRVTHGNLFLEKGRMPGSINFLMEIDTMFSSFAFVPIDILITAINPQGGAMSAWVVRDASPISWAASDLDANSNEVIIDTLELNYRTLKSITL